MKKFKKSIDFELTISSIYLVVILNRNYIILGGINMTIAEVSKEYDLTPDTLRKNRINF